MLRFSVIHPMPNGDTFNFSNHKTEKSAKTKVKKLRSQYRNHPDRFETWFCPLLLKIRDNVKNGWRIP